MAHPWAVPVCHGLNYTPKSISKQIVIALIDRLASYAAREAENEDLEETKRQEEAAARRLAEKVKTQKAKAREQGAYRASSPGSSLVRVNCLGCAIYAQRPVV